jgi:hypothetical protein
MSEERAVVLADWPQPIAGGPEPHVLANDTSLSLRYRTDNDRFAVVHFPLCMYLIFGHPNDEALGGHPLLSRGLKYYAVHEVLNSSLIRMLERRNSVHPRHDPAAYLRDCKHYLFTFQDSTLECVVTENQWWKSTFKVVSSDKEAEQSWRAPSDA